MGNSNEVTFLVSFTVSGDDPRTTLATELIKIDHKDITEVELLEDDEFDFIGGLEDDYDFFQGLDTEQE